VSDPSNIPTRWKANPEGTGLDITVTISYEEQLPFVFEADFLESLRESLFNSAVTMQ
jgi:hypothetical protein